MFTLATLLAKIQQMGREPEDLELTRNEYRVLVARVAELDAEGPEENEEE